MLITGTLTCLAAAIWCSNQIRVGSPLLLLEDARTLLQKRKLCPKKLRHLRGSPKNGLHP